MNIGQNIFNIVVEMAGPLLLVAMIIVGIYFAFKREFSKLIGVALVMVVAILLVFNTEGVKDFLLGIGNKVLGLGG